jgi:hypothetical protein
MDNTETTISIWVKLPEEISRLIMDIKKSTGVYYPDHEESLPHTNLYSAKFNEAKYPALLEALKDLDFPRFEARIGKLEFEEQPFRNYVFVSFSYTNPEQFIDLHQQVLGIANPFRGDLIRYKDVERYKNGKMTEEGWERTRKYGFQYFMEKYYPHITIGVVEVGDQEKSGVLKEKLKELEGKPFPVDKVSVKFKRKSLPDEKKVFESKITEIPLR